MKYAMMCLGFVLLCIGAAGFDSNMAIGTAFVLIGLCLIVPFSIQYDKEEEIRERHERKHNKK